MPFFYFSARIIRKLGLKTTLIITVFSTSIRLFLYSVVSNPEIAIFIEIFQGISWSLFWVCCVQYVDLLVKEEWKATGQSLLYASFLGAGAIVGNLWTGYLYESKMNISEIFLLNSLIVIIIGILMVVFLKNVRNQIINEITQEENKITASFSNLSS